jgi:endoglucanase
MPIELTSRLRAVAAAVVAVLALAGGAASADAAGGGFVRVNQVGYPAGAPKRAYLMTRHTERGASFSIRRVPDGAVVFTGGVGRSVGSWSAAWPHVYALDFDALQTPGVYEITIDGQGVAASPRFAIGAAASLYAPALANARSFYGNERDGPEFIPSALRTAAGHLNDAHALTYLTPQVNEEGEFGGDLQSLGTTIDASGGWWDAGDYLKFVQTTSYTVAMQLVGVRDFPGQMGAGAGTADFTDEARFGLEWLLRMWDDPTRTLYYQVGIGAGNAETISDHDIWRLPQEDDSYGGEDPRYRYIRHRPVFRAGPPGSPVSPNLAGRDAAAFGLCYQVFARTLPGLADRCLLAGEHIFELADTDPHGNLLTAIPFGFYPETEWRDDLELGATELALALSDGPPPPAGLPHADAAYYLAQAASWAKRYVVHAHGASDPLNLYDVSGLAHSELVRALRLAGSPARMAISERGLLANLRSQLQADVALSRRDPFGFGFPWNTADTASHASGLSVMAAEYDYLTDTSTYSAYAGRWLANVLGANAWGSSFIIGDGSTFPRCPQHQVANIVGALDGSSPILAGAVVEGPGEEASRGLLSGMRECPAGGGNAFARFDSKAVYKDNVQSFTTVEPAIDLTASSMLAFSWQIAVPAGP